MDGANRHPRPRRFEQVTYVLPDGPVGVVGNPSPAEREAYEEVWRVVGLLRLVGGSPHWWDATFGGSVASTMPLRERLVFSCAGEMLVWVGGDANMNGVAAGSWSGGVYAIVRTADCAEATMAFVENDLGKENVIKDQLLVAIWEFLCFFMIAAACAARWNSKIVLYVTDNMLVQRWITLARARHDSGNFICGLLTLLMARFRFELFSVYINTERNMRDEPSRIFDAGDVRKGPTRSKCRHPARGGPPHASCPRRESADAAVCSCTCAAVATAPRQRSACTFARRRGALHAPKATPEWNGHKAATWK